MKKLNWNIKFSRTEAEERKKAPSFKTVLLIVGFIVLAFLNVTQSLTIVQLQYKNADLNDKMLDFQNESKVLTEKLEKIDTDQYIEEKAREHLSMVKSGETPIKVYQEKNKEVTENRNIEPKDKIGIYIKDWYLKLEEWVQGTKKE